jgi:uroporphyrinogen decarboxylase
MNDRLTRALLGEVPDQVPFVPAIYEHKGWFVGRTPSSVARDERLLSEALQAEYEQVRPDALTIGVDVYNVEAEAAGCTVVYHDDNAVPAIAPDGAVFREGMTVASLRMPDPAKDGRMPMLLEVARSVVAALGGALPVRTAISAPFSLAAHLAGPETFLMLTKTDPATVNELLLFASKAIQRYAQAILAQGSGIVMFDSHASPDLISPRMYREVVLPPTRSLISWLTARGVPGVPLIVGGNTTPVIDAYLETGANNILCDASADASVFLDRCARKKRAFRRNISSSDFLEVPSEEAHRRAARCLHESGRYPGFILGTAVLPYGTPLTHLAAIQDAIQEYRTGPTSHS